MHFLFRELPPHLSAVVFLGIGICSGTLLAAWIEYLTADAPGEKPRGPLRCVPLIGPLLAIARHPREAAPFRRQFAVEVAAGVLFAAFVYCMLALRCQETPSVVPSEFWRHARIIYHLALLSLLIAATGTDFRDYVIPDAITVTGIVLAIAGATYSGELQIVHLWIDWNNEQPLIGPYIPTWLDPHRHLHGLAWSTAGLAAGAGITWCVRVVSSLLLGQESLGFGDVTLMAMIGAFVGWQPVVLIFLLAPFCGLLVVGAVRLASARTYVPYGPFLSAATLVVLFTWKWLWEPMRYIFGHAPSLILLAAASFTALVVLLGLLRLYRTIPVTRRSSTHGDEASPEADPHPALRPPSPSGRGEGEGE